MGEENCRCAGVGAFFGDFFEAIAKQCPRFQPRKPEFLLLELMPRAKTSFSLAFGWLFANHCGMSAPRLLGEGRSFYHCVSRVVDRRFVFESRDKAVFRRILRLLERFSGVRVVTYCLMSNHFHLLLDVPDREELAPLRLEELLELLPELHDPVSAEGVRQEIERALASERAEERNAAWRREMAEAAGEDGGSGFDPDPRDPSHPDAAGDGRDRRDSGELPELPGGLEGAAFWEGAAATGVAGILERYERRRGYLSVFMRELKQRVTLYMNQRLDRVGTLWESRFKSVLVEGDEAALMAVAAYIDLNPVRAGMVARPEDYPWSGYGEAASKGRGAKRARQGLGTILREALGPCGQDAERCGEDWRRTIGRYRLFLYERGEERSADPAPGSGARAGIAASEVDAERARAGRQFGGHGSGAVSESPEETEEFLDLARLGAAVGGLLRCRVRYFTDGGVLGSAEFVKGVIERERDRALSGSTRQSGASRLRGADWGSLRILRNLQKNVFGTGQN